MITVDVATDDELFTALYPQLRRFAAVVGPSDVHPDDLVQEALARRLALGPLSSLDDPGAYLRRTIVNLASNRRRSIQRARHATQLLATVAEAAAATYPSDLADLQRLRPHERAALYLHHVEGMPFSEVALHLDCTEAAARKAASRARQRLEQSLREEES